MLLVLSELILNDRPKACWIQPNLDHSYLEQQIEIGECSCHCSCRTHARLTRWDYFILQTSSSLTMTTGNLWKDYYGNITLVVFFGSQRSGEPGRIMNHASFRQGLYA